MALVLSACGGDATFGGGGNPDGGAVIPGDGAGPLLEARIGVLTGGTFTEGAVAIGTPSLSAGGQTAVRLDVVDAQGLRLSNVPLTASFRSECANAGLSRFEPATLASDSGRFDVTYVAQGCNGADEITAVVQLGGVIAPASGVVDVAAAELGSIEFVFAESTVIGLTGSPIPNQAELRFLVRDTTGSPVPNQHVNFTLDVSTGGIGVTPASAVSDAGGVVRTVVRGGTVPTAARVTATLSATQIATQSEQLAISTGIPDQNSMSLAFDRLAVDGTCDGERINVTLRMADRFNNPVPDGTAISFDTEGGAIASQCVTVNGECSVTWRSQDPRPGNVGGRVTDNGPRAGRVTVMASAIGEESFLDQNGNGVFDDSEIGTITDMPEAFRDADIGTGQASSNYATGEDIFLDYDGDQTWDAANGVYNGLLCRNASTGVIGPCFTRTAGQPDRNTIHVRDSVTLIMSGSAAQMETGDFSVTGNGVTFNGSTIVMPQEGIATFSAVVRDVNDQPLPAGATIALEVADAGSVSGIDSYTVVCHTDDSVDGNTYRFSIKAAKSSDTPPVDVNGTVTLTITTEKGGARAFTFGLVADAP